MDSRRSTHLTAALLLPRDQPLEARVAPERGEGGVDPEPAGRESRSLEQRLQQVECLLRLAHEDVDPGEQALELRPGTRSC